MKTIWIYKHGNFKDGKEIGEGRYNKNRLESWGYHDAISSLKIPFGMQVTLYEHPNWKGKSIELYSDTPWVGKDWNDKVSSLHVSGSGAKPRVELYEHQDYEGNTTVLEPAIDIELKSTAVGNDSVSSVQVPDGYLVALSEHMEKGRVIGLTADARDLNDLKFNDKATLVSVFDEAQYMRELTYGEPPRIPELTGFDFTRLPLETEQVVVAEALVPFHFVHDPQLLPFLQIKESPFYRLVKEVCWERVMSYHHMGLIETSRRKEIKTGMTESATNTVKETLSVEIQKSGGLTFKLGDLGVDRKTSIKIAGQLETTYSSTETKMEEKVVEVIYDFSPVECTIVLWMRKDIYTLQRWDGDLVASWNFRRENHCYGQGWPKSNAGKSLNIVPKIHRIH